MEEHIMRKGILATIVAMLAFGGQALACDQHGQGGIVEENSMSIPVGAKSVNSMDEETFNSTIDKVEEIYAPIIAERGKRLQVIRKWEDGTVNAYAQQTGNTWKVSMFGGLARHKAITPDGFATVVCHELGHHIGGQPKKKSWFGSSWASNEGQADYFATSKCLRKFMENDDNASIIADMEIPAFVIEKCEAQFSTEKDVLLCKRGAMAGLSLADLFKDLRNLTTPLKFDTPDTRVVSTTDHNHPQPQCRLDTYWNGALCDVDAYTDVSDDDYRVGTCARADGYESGIRPLCWFKPSN